MKVYILTADYGSIDEGTITTVKGVFATQELAEKAAQFERTIPGFSPNYDDIYIEEWEVIGYPHTNQG